MGITAAVLSGFGLALIAPWLNRKTGRMAGWILALLPAWLALYFASLIEVVAAGNPARVSHAWIPALGVNFSFYLDGLALLFALLITGIGALVLIYSGGYLAGHPHLGRFYSILLIFMASMLGLVLADNIITLFVFWELTTLSSYLLIGFDHERESARAAALQSLLVTGAGGLALLAGLILLGNIGGSAELSLLLDKGEVIRAHPLYFPVLLLILIGAFTKSAQVPFHFWLPAAMEAPTPVSAYLHSATMVKAGVYLLARTSPALGGTDAWFWSVTGVGAVTMVVGAWMAIQREDLKLILAYSTVSALGILTMLLGIGTPQTVQAAMAFLLGHALYKGALFLVAGAVDHETGTRVAGRLGGLGKAMPFTAAAAAVAALSMAGLPPLFGFISKEMIYEALMEAAVAPALLTGAAALASMLFVAIAAVVGLRPFLGRETHTPKHPHEAPLALWLGPGLLSALGLLLGLFPRLVEATILAPTASAVLGEPATLKLALWHGWNPSLALSAVTLAGGLGAFTGRSVLAEAASRLQAVTRWGPQRWYDLGLVSLNAVARIQTLVLQNGYLRIYLLVVILTTVVLAGAALARAGGVEVSWTWPHAGPYDLVVAAATVLAALAAARSSSRLGAVALLGAVGYAVALIFVIFGAPDLAITQFLVESLTVILFVLIFYPFPDFVGLSPPLTRARDAIVAALVGAMITALLWSATDNRLYPTISEYFTEHSVPSAHGRNIVNVILVDFRALDTLGEITVLGIAALGVYALLKFRRET